MGSHAFFRSRCCFSPGKRWSLSLRRGGLGSPQSVKNSSGREGPRPRAGVQLPVFSSRPVAVAPTWGPPPRRPPAPQRTCALLGRPPPASPTVSGSSTSCLFLASIPRADHAEAVALLLGVFLDEYFVPGGSAHRVPPSQARYQARQAGSPEPDSQAGPSAQAPLASLPFSDGLPVAVPSDLGRGGKPQTADRLGGGSCRGTQEEHRDGSLGPGTSSDGDFFPSPGMRSPSRYRPGCHLASGL